MKTPELETGLAAVVALFIIVSVYAEYTVHEKHRGDEPVGELFSRQAITVVECSHHNTADDTITYERTWLKPDNTFVQLNIRSGVLNAENEQGLQTFRLTLRGSYTVQSFNSAGGSIRFIYEEAQAFSGTRALDAREMDDIGMGARHMPWGSLAAISPSTEIDSISHFHLNHGDKVQHCSGRKI